MTSMGATATQQEVYEWAIIDVLRRQGGGLTESEIAERVIAPSERIAARIGLPESASDWPLLGCRDDLFAWLTLEGLRWPHDAIRCGYCGSADVKQHMNRWFGHVPGARGRSLRSFTCEGCGRPFTFRAGTVLYHSGTPPRFYCYALWAALGPDGVCRRDVARACECDEQGQAKRVLARMRRAGADDPIFGVFAPDLRVIDGRIRHESAA